MCSSWKIAHKSIQYYCYGFAFFMYQYNSVGKEGVGWCVCGVCDIVAKMSWCSFTVVPPSFSLDSDMSFFVLSSATGSVPNEPRINQHLRATLSGEIGFIDTSFHLCLS